MPLFKRESISWGVLAIEMAAIMISVVLGFVLNEWRHSQAEMTAVRTAQQSILRELETNLEHTQHRQTYFQAFNDTLSLIGDQFGYDMHVDPDTLGFHNFPPFVYHTGAYDAALASGALSNMEYDTMEAIMEAYGRQRYYQEQSWALSDWHFDGRWQSILDYVRSNNSMLQRDLPFSQELALRVLRGEDRDEAQRVLESTYLQPASSENEEGP